jgi:hypothetical protein
MAPSSVNKYSTVHYDQLFQIKYKMIESILSMSWNKKTWKKLLSTPQSQQWNGALHFGPGHSRAPFGPKILDLKTIE